MALMAARGLITPMPTAAIFADTQDEPESVYRWLDWLEKQLPFPVHRVTKGQLSARALEMTTTKDGRVFSKADIPLFTKNHDGSIGKIMNRNCTRDFKIHPILKKVRELAGVKRGQKIVGVIQWIGISIDEIPRMKPSREPWCEHRWPLVEMRYARRDCLKWMELNGFPPPPRSACIYCPFHSNSEWRRLKDEEPGAFQKAVEFEHELQRRKGETTNFRTRPFLHRSCVPLNQVDFSTDEERGQGVFGQWSEECEGMCGV
jgi:hypothetical protein